MKILTKNPIVLYLVPGMAMLNALFLFGNGLTMLAIPSAWYHFVPGVPHTGPFNPHFVRDIGLVQMFLGVCFVAGLRAPVNRFALWTAATSWLCAHALLHFWEVAAGICPPSAIVRDFPAVTLPALIGVWLSTLALRLRPHPVLDFVHGHDRHQPASTAASTHTLMIKR